MSLAKARYDATVVYIYMYICMVVTDYISSLRTYTRVKLYAILFADSSSNSFPETWHRFNHPSIKSRFNLTKLVKFVSFDRSPVDCRTPKKASDIAKY